jgi:uncharacterized membrane protein YedE/YeeE
MNFLHQPWPWYVAGPLIGLTVPALLLLGNKKFGISSSLRHVCAMCVPANLPFFNYDWKKERWNLAFVVGIAVGGYLGNVVFANPAPVAMAPETRQYLAEAGIGDFAGLLPTDLFHFGALLTLRGFIFIVVGGSLVGFGTRWAGGCTSGHAIMGLSNLQWPSLVATICFMIGGLLMTWFGIPYLLTL